MRFSRFFHKLRTDLAGLMHYPAIAAGEGMSIDYDRYWERRGGAKRSLSEWQKERADLAASVIAPGSSVLDLGAGDGAMLEYLQEKIRIRPVAVEMGNDSVRALRGRGIEVIEADVSDLGSITRLPDVDYVTGFEIIEHLPNPEALITALRPKVIKAMIFSFPNTGYYTHRLRLLCGRVPLQWIAHPGEHVRFWTAADVRSWAPQLGMRLDKLVLYQGLPGLKRLWPSLFAQGIIIVLTEKR